MIGAKPYGRLQYRNVNGKRYPYQDNTLSVHPPPPPAQYPSTSPRSPRSNRATSAKAHCLGQVRTPRLMPVRACWCCPRRPVAAPR